MRLTGYEQDLNSAEALDCRLSGLEGMDEVTRNLQTGHLILHYDKCQSVNPQFFRSVAETLGVSPTLLHPHKFEKLSGTVDQGNGNGTGSPSEDNSLTLPALVPNIMASTTVIHSLAGRVRLRVPALQVRSQLAEALLIFLQDQEGIQEVRVNSGCSSVTITFDPAVWAGEKLCEFFKGFGMKTLKPISQVGSGGAGTGGPR